MWPFSLFKKTAKTYVIHRPITQRIYTMTTFTFTNRREYLIYKAEWKKRYFETISKIREAALAKRAANQELSKLQPYSDSWYRALTPAHNALHTHWRLKQEATNLLLERARSKIEAGIQREKNLAAA